MKGTAKYGTVVSRIIEPRKAIENNWCKANSKIYLPLVGRPGVVYALEFHFIYTTQGANAEKVLQAARP
jgi:hypothetical protein